METSRRAAIMNGKFESTSKNQDESNLNRPRCWLIREARDADIGRCCRDLVMHLLASRFREDVSCGVQVATMGAPTKSFSQFEECTVKRADGVMISTNRRWCRHARRFCFFRFPCRYCREPDRGLCRLSRAGNLKFRTVEVNGARRAGPWPFADRLSRILR